MTKARGRGSRQADIAREAGVSQSTVSMVLSGSADLGRISHETRRRVLSAAARLRYSAAPQQRSGGSRPALLLGVHTFESIFPISARDYYFEFLQGIEEQATVEGCNLVLFTGAQDEDGVRRIYHGSVNRLRQAAGSVLLGHHALRDDLTRLTADNYPFVYIGHRDVPGQDICYVGGDYRSATGRIVDDLVALGHRTFGYLGEANRFEPQVDRWEGFATAVERFGLVVPEPAFTRPEELTAQWLDTMLAAGVTAILVESVSLLRVLAAMINLKGLSVPADLSVVLLVDDPGADIAGRPWSSMQVPRNDMGRRAVRLLKALLTDPAGDHERQILLPCAHVLEPTTAPRR